MTMFPVEIRKASVYIGVCVWANKVAARVFCYVESLSDVSLFASFMFTGFDLI